MRKSRARVTLSGVRGALKRFTLELDCDADPIAGRLLDEGGESRSFAGWLDLAAALEHFSNSEEPETNRRGPPSAN
jgi:hypothetical protein